MEDENGWCSLGEIRPIYRDAGTDSKVVGWEKQPDGRTPMIECRAFEPPS